MLLFPSSSSLSLSSREFSDAKVFDPQIRALLGFVFQVCSISGLYQRARRRAPQVQPYRPAAILTPRKIFGRTSPSDTPEACPQQDALMLSSTVPAQLSRAVLRDPLTVALFDLPVVAAALRCRAAAPIGLNISALLKLPKP